MTRLDDLPPRLRRAAIAAIARDELVVATRTAATRARQQPAARASVWRCHSCGAISKSWAAAIRHADNEKHARVELDIQRTEDEWNQPT